MKGTGVLGKYSVSMGRNAGGQMVEDFAKGMERAVVKRSGGSCTLADYVLCRRWRGERLQGGVKGVLGSIQRETSVKKHCDSQGDKESMTPRVEKMTYIHWARQREVQLIGVVKGRDGNVLMMKRVR